MLPPRSATLCSRCCFLATLDESHSGGTHLVRLWPPSQCVVTRISHPSSWFQKPLVAGLLPVTAVLMSDALNRSMLNSSKETVFKCSQTYLWRTRGAWLFPTGCQQVRAKQVRSSDCEGFHRLTCCYEYASAVCGGGELDSLRKPESAFRSVCNAPEFFSTA